MHAHELGDQATKLRDQGKGEEAAALYGKAKAAYLAEGDSAGAARCQHAIGLCYKIENDLSRAVAAYQQAIADYQAAGIQFGEARVERDLGIMLEYHDRFEEAEEHLTRSHELLLDMPSGHATEQSVTGQLSRDAELGITLAKLGLLYTRMEARRDEAESLIIQGLELIRSVGHPFYEMTAMMHLGSFYLLQDYPGRGLANLLGGLGLIYEHNMQAEQTRRLAQIRGLLAHAYLALGNRVTARHFAHKSTEAIAALSPAAQMPLLKDIRFEELLAAGLGL